jgi:ligand-binding sensor domain-containing protein/signal transduction histidine kinase
MAQYMREQWNSEKGFPGGGVTALAQSADGYLWIGTKKGLVRFDGLNFRGFQQTAVNNFPIGPVQGLQSDAQGNLWILLANTRVLRYRDGKFEPGGEQAEFGITAMSRKADGTVLLSSLAWGSLTYHAGKFDALNPAPQPPPAAAESNDEMSTRLSWATGVTPHRYAEPNAAVLTSAEGNDGRIWLGTEEKGIFSLKDGRISGLAKSAELGKINCLLSAADGGLWVGTEHGLAHWDGQEFTAENVPAALAHVRILTMARDRDANIWLGTQRGLFRLNRSGLSEEEEGRNAAAPVTSLTEDREGNLWVGRPEGIERLRDSPFVTYTLGKDVSSESDGPVYVDAQGRVWFGPLDGGLFWLRDGKIHRVTKAGLDKDVVYSIAGSGDEIWVGRQQGGLTRLNLNGDDLKATTYTHAEGLIQDNVYAVHQSHDGTVWAGTLSGGISAYRDGKFASYNTARGLASNTVAAIQEGSDGTMWFATPNGLNSLSHGQWRDYTYQDGLPSTDVNCVMEDSSHVLWIGTAGGLALLDGGKIRKPHDMPVALNEPIFGIADDRKGWLWISTSYHVLRVRRAALLNDALAQGDVQEYGLADGLEGVEGMKRHQSVFKDAQGRIWFSMNQGLSVVDPERVLESAPPVPVRIESASADGNGMDLSRAVEIPSAFQRTIFHFAGVSLSFPERVRYRYKLEGFDRDWSEPVGMKMAIYTNLSPKTYTFHVIACNSDGIWNDTGASLRFRVTPAWYQTMWFRSLCVLLGGFVVWSLYQLRLRQIATAMSARFDERLAERTRLARELHDTLLQTIQGSKMIADDALDQPADAARLQQSMRRLSTWLEQAVQEGRAALNSLRTTSTLRNDLSQSFQQAATDCAGPEPMEVALSVTGKSRELHPIVRDEVYRIGYEAIRNACRHSGGTRLEIDMTYAHDFVLRVADNGKGIDPAIVARGKPEHFGLQGMRERAARIGGKLALTTSEIAGTEFRLVIPGRIIFQDAQGRGSVVKRLSRLLGKRTEPAGLG